MAPGPAPTRSLLAGPWQVLIVAGLAGFLFLAYGPGYVGIDAMWSLTWGRDLVHLSALSESGTTTPHVLSNLLGAALTPFGADADRALVGLEYLAAAGLVWVVALTAREVAGTAAGVLAGVLMATREQLLFATRAGFLDVFAAAVVVWAVFLLVRWRGERLRGVVVLLSLAGLLRPEPWVLLVVVVAVQWRRARRVELAVFAAVIAVPLLWALSDLVLSGDMLFSLHETHRVSDLVRIGQHIPTGFKERLISVPRNLAHAPGPELFLLALFFGALVLWPGAAAARLRARAFGEVAACRQLEPLRVIAGAALVIAVVIAGEALTGTLLFARFALPFAGLVVALVAGCLGLVARAHLGTHTHLALAAAGAALVLIAVPFLAHARRTTDPEHARYEAARAVLRPGVGDCTPIVVPGVNFRPFAAVWAGVRGDEVVAASEGMPSTGTFVDAVGREPERFLLDPSFPQERLGSVGGTVLRSGNGWTLRSRCSR